MDSREIRKKIQLRNSHPQEQTRGRNYLLEALRENLLQSIFTLKITMNKLCINRIKLEKSRVETGQDLKMDQEVVFGDS